MHLKEPAGVVSTLRWARLNKPLSLSAGRSTGASAKESRNTNMRVSMTHTPRRFQAAAARMPFARNGFRKSTLGSACAG